MRMKLKYDDLKEFLDEKVEKYNRPDFIESDPISIPHLFTGKEDIEISGFLAATIAWGNRTMILRNANRMMAYLDDSPYDFVLNHTEKILKESQLSFTEHLTQLTLYILLKLLKIFINLKMGWKQSLMKTRLKIPYSRRYINSEACFSICPTTTEQ